MKMKKEKNNGSAKRLIIILSLCLALLVALGAFSFAWIRNYIDVDNLEVTTGKMLYNFKLYRVENGVLKPVTFFDTNDSADAAAGNSEAKLEKNLGIEKPLVNIDNGEEIFFVIEKYDDSIEFDVAISFDNDGLPQNFEYIGQMNYAMFDDSAALEGVSSQEALETYLKSPTANSAKAENLGNIWKTVQKTSLEGDQKYALIRLKLSKNATSSADLEGSSFPFRIGFCVAQKDALPDDMKVDKFYVDDVPTLENAMQNYGFGDEIYFTEDVNYTGDLVFTRPCTITFIRSTLTVKGNLVFSYMYGGKFVVNTVSDGHIRIEKNNSSGGNFQIDLPDTTIELSGANNDAAGKADIYVEGEFTANASKNEGEGLLFRGSRICNVSVENGKYTYLTDLKPILINSSTRMSISNRTRIGKLSVNFHCRKFILENNGYIEKIDLTEMTQDVTLLSSPCILIDNAGTVGTVNRAESDVPTNSDGDVILLPAWSRKYDPDDKTLAEDNTHIIANKGSGKMLAITPNNSFEDSVSVVNSGKFFYSRGDKEESGYRDDIDYKLRTQFVETVGGDKTNIIVHYETPAQIVLNEDRYKDLASLTNLKTYIDYYADKGEIAPASELKEVTVICYGEKALSAPPLKANSTTVYESGLEYDYNFIKSMTALTKLDLSDAVSVNKKVPDNAFKGLSSLSKVEMSESDTVWGKYLFTGTAVDEITLPQSLTKMENHRDTWNMVDKQETLDGIRFVYTSITIVDGIYSNRAAIQYYFTPDQYTYDEYRKLNPYGEIEWHARIFLNNGVKRHGDYFLRYDPNSTEVVPTCEFVVFTGGVTFDKDNKEVRQPWVDEEEFDFQKVHVDGDVYVITSFDPYAFFNKLYSEEGLNITLSADVETIGKYAFACSSSIYTTKGLTSVVIEGNPNIMGNAFSYNDALVSFSAPELTTLKGGYNLSNNEVLKTVYTPKLSTVEGAGDLANCAKLESVDISVIDKTDSNKNFYTSNDKYFFTRFYIHTENARDVSDYTSALAADYRYIFVKESYAKLYRATSTYTGVVNMGENPLDALIAADADGNDLVEGKQLAYYYVIDGDKARLVACLLSEINALGKDYTTISSFKHGNVTYPVSYIGSAAYHFTYIIAQNIKICDGVVELGDYAFDARKSAFKKYCVILDLNDVVKAGKFAFYYVDMAKITGDSLEEVGDNTLSYNQNLILVNLPNLSRSRPAGSTNSAPKVFLACKNLRLAYVGFSSDITFDVDDSRRKSYIRFINFVGTEEEISIPRVNTVINSSVPNYPSEYFNSFTKTDKSFTGIYLSDYYEYKVDLMGLTDVIELPGYVYHKNENGELSLIAVSPDIELFGDYRINEKGNSDYITPSKLYNSNGRYVSKDNGTEPEFVVTSFGNYAYGAVSMSGIETFRVADTVSVLNYGALSGSAYENSNSSIVTLLNVKCLDLANVTNIGKQACRGAKIEKLIAPNLQVLAVEAFLNATYLKTVYLPAFVSAGERDTFKNCAALTEVTFGPNAKTLVNNMFDGANNLTKITILNPNSVVSTGAGLRSSNPGKITVMVPASIYEKYKEKYEKTGFAKIPFTNFQKFGASTQIGNLTYYWNVFDETEKTAYIDYVEGDVPTNFTFPATLDGYKIVSVNKTAIAALTDVTKIVLPTNMKYLSFDNSDLSDSVEELVISDTNGNFKTVDGVLYSKDGKILYIYPKAKSNAKFTVSIGVTEIAYRAFYDTKNLVTLTIEGTVIVRDQAFEKTSISTIGFSNTKASTFAGRDIFLEANVSLRINVPGAYIDAYKANVLIDYSIISKFVGA